MICNDDLMFIEPSYNDHFEDLVLNGLSFDGDLRDLALNELNSGGDPTAELWYFDDLLLNEERSDDNFDDLSKRVELWWCPRAKRVDLW